MLSNKRFKGWLTWLLLLSLIFSFYSTSILAQDIAAPVAQKIPKVDTLNGEIRVDNYFWLRERDNPEVISYLEAENKYTDVIMMDTERFQESLFNELLSRIKETDLTVPVKMDEYYYYSRTEEGKQYKIHCRKKGSLSAEEKVLLDVNLLAEGYPYFYVGAYRISPNHQLLAYSVDTSGAENYTVYVKNLNSGKLLEDIIPNASDLMEWGNDNMTLFYSTLDEIKRPYKLYRHKLGTNSSDDSLLYHEKDEAYYLNLSKSKSKAYIFMSLESITTTEVHFLDAENPSGDFKIIHPRQYEMEYSVEHHGNKFYILTNDNAKNFKLMETSVENPSRENWVEIIPHRDSVKIDRIEPFKNHLVIYERENGLKKIRIADLSTGVVHNVEFLEPVYTLWKAENPDFNTNILRFTYTSLLTPESVFDYNMDNRTRELKKQSEVLGGYDPSLYQSERIFARAKDGTAVPISLVFKKGITKDGNNPLLLDGYGSYGISSEPYFSSNRLSLLNRGFIYAIAHVRGGGEMGRYWYEDGKLLKKRNTFTDFIACAEYLIAEKYTSSDKLVATGGSAGGLLMGAITNMRPDLFKIVIAEVPFVDVVNTMMDPTIPLTVTEYEEWGNPHNKEYYDYIRSYSPYDNVETRDYPNLLISAGLNDPRVAYWEPAKWTAKLRALKTDTNLLLLKTNMGAGHGGASGRYDYLKEIAFEYAFIFKVLGIGR